MIRHQFSPAWFYPQRSRDNTFPDMCFCDEPNLDSTSATYNVYFPPQLTAGMSTFLGAVQNAASLLVHELWRVSSYTVCKMTCMCRRTSTAMHLGQSSPLTSTTQQRCYRFQTRRWLTVCVLTWRRVSQGSRVSEP